MCRQHVARVRARRQDLGAANAVLAVISAEPAEEIAPVAQQEGWTVPVLGDPERRAFRAYGLGRLPWWRVYNAASLLFYGGRFLRRLPAASRGQDPLQQGGDFIVGGDGIIRFAYAGRTFNDRPRVDDVIRCLKAIAPASARAS